MFDKNLEDFVKSVGLSKVSCRETTDILCNKCCNAEL